MNQATLLVSPDLLSWKRTRLSTLRDVDENGADGFADLAQDIRLISGRVGEVTQF